MGIGFVRYRDCLKSSVMYKFDVFLLRSTPSEHFQENAIIATLWLCKSPPRFNHSHHDLSIAEGMAGRQTHHSFFHGLKLELFYDFVRSCHSKGVARLLPSPPYVNHRLALIIRIMIYPLQRGWPGVKPITVFFMV